MFLKKIEDKIHKKVSPSIKVEFIDGCISLTGEVEKWEDVVSAGTLAVDKTHSRGVVNDITVKNYKPLPMRIPDIKDNKFDGLSVDIAVIGGGVVGCLIARELSRFDIKIALIEKEYDVATAASSRNDGMVHPGIDLHKGSKKLEYNARGNQMYGEVCKELGVDFARNGSYILFDRRWQKMLIPIFKMIAKRNRIPNLRYAKKSEVKKAEPQAGDWQQGGIFLGSSGIVCPYSLTVAAAENAVSNGVTLCLNTAVIDMELKNSTIVSLKTNRGKIIPKIVIDAAGVYSDKIAQMGGDRFFTIHPRKGTDIILDNKSKTVNTVMARTPFFRDKHSHTKGGGIVRTVDGNILVGPNAVEIPEREDVTTNPDSVNEIMTKHGKCAEKMNNGQIITCFSGVRAATYEEDFIVEKSSRTKNLIFAAGIQSPGLTAAPAIAQDICKMVTEALEFPPPNARFNPIRKKPPKPSSLSFEERNELIKSNPDYGVIVCRCEQVSKGEILDAIRSPIPALTLDSIKRRARPGMGRCQGGFCAPLITQIIAEEMGIAQSEVCKAGIGSNIIIENNKEVYSDEI